MGVLFGGILLALAVTAIAIGVRTGKARLPVQGIEALFLPTDVNRETNPGGYMAVMLLWGLIGFAGLVMAFVSALT